MTNTPKISKPIRITPAIIIVLIQWFVRFIVPRINPDLLAYGIFAGVLGFIFIVVWWLFFSRAKWMDRILGLLVMALSLFVTFKLLHISLATANMGMMFALFSPTFLSLGFVIWAVSTRYIPVKLHRVTMIFAIILFTGFWALLRSDGMDGYAHHNLRWRWSKTAEEKLLESQSDMLTKSSALRKESITSNEWLGFRGEKRDGIVNKTKFETDWKKSPPVELWRRPIGPGCSSMAIKGDMLYTQEQRGDYEMVTCYSLSTGDPIWQHQDSARFWDSHAGAGPRSTPTISGDRIYTLGATGIINALNASDGSLIWTRNGSEDTGIKPLMWAFAGSPLVVDSVVIFALAGKLAAYHIKDGKLLWYGEDGGNSYSSPQAFTIDGTLQVVHMSTQGAISYNPYSGNQNWRFDWKMSDRILQTAIIDPNDFLLSADGERGVKRINVSSKNGNWGVKEVWSSTEMKLNFNDFFIHKGYAYGFDGPSLCCIDIKDGKRVWKGNRYRGFMILLADQDLLVILGEKGELALAEAKPDGFKELSKIQAIKGRTWNHPAIAGNIVITRNAIEMVAYKLQ